MLHSTPKLNLAGTTLITISIICPYNYLFLYMSEEDEFVRNVKDDVAPSQSSSVENLVQFADIQIITVNRYKNRQL